MVDVNDFWGNLELMCESELDALEIFYGFYGDSKDEEELILGLSGIEPDRIEQVEDRRQQKEILDKLKDDKEKSRIELLKKLKFRRSSEC